jgi:regulatory protein
MAASGDITTAIYRYCNYQERSHAEVRNKLYELGCTTPEVEQHIADLIEKGLLNEERYARAIARGKFRMKQWGRVKIVQQLKLQRVSEYCIRKALTEIDEDEYIQTLQKLAEKKWLELRSERNMLVRKGKAYKYLAQRGYESSLIQDALKEIIKNDT